MDPSSDRAPATVIECAGLDDLDALAPLFDAYRQFYRETSDPSGARTFLRHRLEKGESVVFVARRGGAAVGFVQLYPTFSSTAMRTMWILNDLFVLPAARRQGVATLLLERSKRLAEETGAESVILETAVDNPAQKLYEARGWKLDRAFLHYEWLRP